MFRNCTNYKKQGDIGLGSAINWFTTNHYTVCVPLTDSQDYDLIVEKENIISRIQIKTSAYLANSGNYVINLKVCGGNRSGNTIKLFDNTKVEYLFALLCNGDRYLIPSRQISAQSSLTISESLSQYKLI